MCPCFPVDDAARLLLRMCILASLQAGKYAAHSTPGSRSHTSVTPGLTRARRWCSRAQAAAAAAVLVSSEPERDVEVMGCDGDECGLPLSIPASMIPLPAALELQVSCASNPKPNRKPRSPCCHRPPHPSPYLAATPVLEEGPASLGCWATLL
jgi:hypothetical protein